MAESTQKAKGHGEQAQTMKYTIRNLFKEPMFEETMEIELLPGEPFIRVMERAANLNQKFRFSVEYYGELGYMVTGINKVVSNYSGDGSYWHILDAPHKMKDKGVSNFNPEAGDHVIIELSDEAGIC